MHAVFINISCIHRIQGDTHPSFILPLAFIHKHVHQWANLILGIFIMFEHINAIIVSGQINDRFVQGNIRPHFNFAHCQLANLRLGEFYSLSYLNITKSCLGKLKTVRTILHVLKGEKITMHTVASSNKNSNISLNNDIKGCIFQIYKFSTSSIVEHSAVIFPFI